MSDVIAIHREPFASLAPRVYRFAEGRTLLEMASGLTSLPRGWPRHEGDVICINGTPVPRAAWPLVKPKPQGPRGPVTVTFHAPPMGGGGDGDKNPLAVVAAVALAVVTSGIASGALLAGVTGGAGVTASLLAGVVGLVGATVINALSPIPSLNTDAGQDGAVQRGTASAEGNVLSPNAPIPRVVGTRRIFPPFLTEPLSYFQGQDEVVEAVLALAGPHNLADIKIAKAAIADVTGLEFEVREGWPGDAPLTLITRQARSQDMRNEVGAHTISGDNGATLESATGNITDALPQALTYATRDGPDEVWLPMVFPGGLHRSASTSAIVRVPLRLRLRPVGGEWVDLPELHYAGADLSEQRATIKLIWEESPSVTREAASNKGWVEARTYSPNQVLTPTSPSRMAHADFHDGSGDVWMGSGNLGTTGVQNVSLDRQEARIHLDTAQFPKGRYEVEIKRGYAFRQSVFSSANYTINAQVRDPCWYEAGPAIGENQDGISSNVILLRGISIRNQHPVPTDDCALIAIRAVNRRIEGVSVLASGYVPDWNGSAWVDWVTTSNPAPHYRDIIGGMMNADPVPGHVIDDDGLVAWRSACVSSGYEVNAVLEGQSVADVARLVASSGYARPMESEIIGVMRDYDRRTDVPVQVFSPRNSANVTWSRGFQRLPQGLRVSFADKDMDYEPRQITIWPDPAHEGSPFTEQVSFDAEVDEARLRSRVAYDLRALQARAVIWTLDAAAEAINCRRGSLVALDHDMLSAHRGSARVTSVEYDETGDITGLDLDSEVPVLFGDEWADIDDLGVVTDMGGIGSRTGVMLRRTDGRRTIHELAGPAGSAAHIRFATPLSDDTGLATGVHVTVGPLDREVRRMIVTGMRPRRDLSFQMTLVDEAPELWT